MDWDRVAADARKKRIRITAMELITARVASGQVNALDDAALRAAVAQASREATAIHDADWECEL